MYNDANALIWQVVGADHRVLAYQLCSEEVGLCTTSLLPGGFTPY